MLIECGWAAVKKKDSYLRAKYYSLVPRMGKKQALCAVAHKMVVASYHILKNKVAYKDLGADYLQKNRQDKQIAYYLKRLEKLGYEAETVAPDAA